MQAITESIARQLGINEPNVLPHVVVRLAVLLGEDVHYLDTDGNGRTASPEPWAVLAMGAKRVVLMRIVPIGPATDVAVTTEVWSERRLRAIELAPVQGAFGHNNSWHDLPKAGLPDGATLKLTYEGQADQLTLPMGWERPSVELLQSLLEDLG